MGVRNQGAPKMCGARVYNSANQNVTNNSETDLTFDSERFDTDAFHSTSSNTNRLTAPTSGYYLIGGSVQWDTNATNSRALGIRYNGTGNYLTLAHSASTGAASQGRMSVSTLYFLNATEYVTLTAYQDSGTTRTVNNAYLSSPEFWISRVAAN